MAKRETGKLETVSSAIALELSRHVGDITSCNVAFKIYVGLQMKKYISALAAFISLINLGFGTQKFIGDIMPNPTGKIISGRTRIAANQDYPQFANLVKRLGGDKINFNFIAYYFHDSVIYISWSDCGYLLSHTQYEKQLEFTRYYAKGRFHQIENVAIDWDMGNLMSSQIPFYWCYYLNMCTIDESIVFQSELSSCSVCFLKCDFGNDDVFWTRNSYAKHNDNLTSTTYIALPQKATDRQVKRGLFRNYGTEVDATVEEATIYRDFQAGFPRYIETYSPSDIYHDEALPFAYKVAINIDSVSDITKDVSPSVLISNAQKSGCKLLTATTGLSGGEGPRVEQFSVMKLLTAIMSAILIGVCVLGTIRSIRRHNC